MSASSAAEASPLRRYLCWGTLASGVVLALGAGACTVPFAWDLLSTGGTRVFGGPEGWLMLALFGGAPFVAGLTLLTLGLRLLHLRGLEHAAAGLALAAAGVCALTGINLPLVFGNDAEGDWRQLAVIGGVPLAVAVAGLALAAWVLAQARQGEPSA